MSAAPASRRICANTLAGLLTSGSATLWQADQLVTPALPVRPSGFAELDAELPGGGWPHHGLTELLLRQPGSGELRLLAPALRQLGEREGIWIAPPYPPYAPALQELGLPLARLLWLQPASDADAAWAAEQVLRAGSAGAVLWWSREALPATLRRLHLAAQEGSTLLFALRAWGCRQQSSPAPLRLTIEPAAGARLCVHLFKRRGPSLARPLLLSLPHPAPERRLSVIASPTEDVVVGPAPALATA